MYSNKFIEKDLKYKTAPINYFQEIRLFLMKLIIFMKKYENLFDKYGEKKFYSDGLIIKTSLESKLQKLQIILC